METEPHKGTMGSMETEICPLRNRFQILRFHSVMATIEKYLNQHQAPKKS